MLREGSFSNTDCRKSWSSFHSCDVSFSRVGKNDHRVAFFLGQIFQNKREMGLAHNRLNLLQTYQPSYVIQSVAAHGSGADEGGKLLGML